MSIEELSNGDYLAELRRKRQEETDRGEYCCRCGAWIFFPKPPGYRRECSDCKALHGQAETAHKKFIRCPGCGHTWDPFEEGSSGVFEDGPHDVSCEDCGHEFKVTTRVSYVFTSPERVDPESDEEDD